MKTRKKKITSLFIVTMISIAFTACSKDDGGSDNVPNASVHKMILKAETSGSTIHHILYGYDDEMTSVSGISETSWTSQEIVLPENASVANFTANAVGVNDASTLKLQIFVDGVLKKEEVGTGTILSVRTHHNLR